MSHKLIVFSLASFVSVNARDAARPKFSRTSTQGR